MNVFPTDVNAVPSMGSNRVSKNKGPKPKNPHEMEHTPQDKAPPKRKKNTSTNSGTLDSTGLLEAAVADANREVNMLFSKYADVLSERAEEDVSQVRELEGIVMEARNLETYLKEKKAHLRRTLALISDKLQH